jgi:hypothetical protein
LETINQSGYSNIARPIQRDFFPFPAILLITSDGGGVNFAVGGMVIGAGANFTCSSFWHPGERRAFLLVCRGKFLVNVLGKIKFYHPVYRAHLPHIVSEHKFYRKLHRRQYHTAKKCPAVNSRFREVCPRVMRKLACKPLKTNLPSYVAVVPAKEPLLLADSWGIAFETTNYPDVIDIRSCST